ncbi:MAG: hypothetical protein NT027_15695, partial [Proteobacteria bacterium]|nr:hypothetical protein [Pseudomonadota bacterium]
MLGLFKVKHIRLNAVKPSFVAVFVVQFCSNLQAQDVATKFGGSISDVPIISSRANAMSGAVAGSADRYDALYYNPAGIAGNLYYGENNKEPFVKQVIVPRVGLTANENSQDLHSEFSANGAVNNSTKGSSLIKSHEGNHQYARFSFTPVGLFFGNMALVPIVDQQISAVPQNTEEGDIQFQYRSLNGVLVGSALHDAKGVLSVGVSTFLGTLQDTKGIAPYKELVDVKAREEIMKQKQNTYSAKSMNIGVKMKIPKKFNPSFSIVARNAGNPVYESTKSGKDSLTMKEDFTAAMAIAPRIGKIGRFHL